VHVSDGYDVYFILIIVFLELWLTLDIDCLQFCFSIIFAVLLKLENTSSTANLGVNSDSVQNPQPYSRFFQYL